jgi:cell wall-associated NlpC family hydrolase
MKAHRIPGKQQGLRRRVLLTGAVLLLGLILAGCATRSAPPPGAEPAAPPARQATGKAASIVRTARTLIGAPYVWGGHSPSTGFDCSGLVWFTYRQNGITLPRISWQQFGTGSAVSFDELRPGDLIFHKVESKGKSLHVGIVTDRGTFVHAPSSGKRVMESSLANTYWRDHFIGARRVL